MEVMESNALCSILVLMFTVPRVKTAVLCTLDYTDHTRCLPTRVHFESEGRTFMLEKLYLNQNNPENLTHDSKGQNNTLFSHNVVHSASYKHSIILVHLK